jgi:hypothetical protein
MSNEISLDEKIKNAKATAYDLLSQIEAAQVDLQKVNKFIADCYLEQKKQEQNKSE